MPGFLIPADLQRFKRLAGTTDFFEWAEQHLRASPGAMAITHDGTPLGVQTLVPATRDGPCVFLAADGKCSIHNDAPFGCAFFDSHQSLRKGNEISSAGLRSVIVDRVNGGEYSRLWEHLHSRGLTTLGPRHLRQCLE